MIQKIASLEEIGKFSSFTQEKEFKYGQEGQNCNIIFGTNGSGKTTLSNAISFFSDNSFISENEKKELFNDIKNNETSKVSLKINHNEQIYPNKEHNNNIYVFNSNFIRIHVFDGSKGKLKKFSNFNPQGEIKNEAINKIQEKINELKEEKEKVEKENKDFETKLKTLTSTFSKDFANNLTDKGKRLSSLNLQDENQITETEEELRKQLSKQLEDYELSKNQHLVSEDIDKLACFSFQEITMDFVKINDILNTSVAQLSKEALQAKIQEINTWFVNEEDKQNLEKWFKFGKDILNNSQKHSDIIKCPICDSDITSRLDLILQNFNGYFDKNYDKFISELTDLQNNFQKQSRFVEEIETQFNALTNLYTKYKTQSFVEDLPSFDFKSLKENIINILNAFDVKQKNIQYKHPAYIPDIFQTFNDSVEKWQFLAVKLKEFLVSKKLNRGNIEDCIRKIYKKLILLNFGNSNILKYKQNQKRINEIATTDKNNTEGLLFYQNELRNELQKIKLEAKSLSKILKLMGIDNFTVDLNETNEDENIIVTYNSTGKDKHNLKNTLSDGEKTSLAFAYFLSKFENERDTEDKQKTSVVVIDDPISSLDENRLYSTAYLIKDMFSKVKQIIVLSHNLLFLKFFNKTINSECFILEKNKLTALPEELENFESPYFYMLNKVIKYANDEGDDYQEAKKYLPNYIRRVLETFLSFKFARVETKQKNGKKRHHSPELVEFNEDIDSFIKNNEIKKKIDKISRITDVHSHGNGQLTQESFYISEEELKKISKEAIDVIDNIDNVHKLAAERYTKSEQSPIKKEPTIAKEIDFNPLN